jgi:hypothetical protein
MDMFGKYNKNQHVKHSHLKKYSMHSNMPLMHKEHTVKYKYLNKPPIQTLSNSMILSKQTTVKMFI